MLFVKCVPYKLPCRTDIMSEGSVNYFRYTIRSQPATAITVKPYLLRIKFFGNPVCSHFRFPLGRKRAGRDSNPAFGVPSTYSPPAVCASAIPLCGTVRRQLRRIFMSIVCLQGLCRILYVFTDNYDIHTDSFCFPLLALVSAQSYVYRNPTNL